MVYGIMRPTGFHFMIRLIGMRFCAILDKCAGSYVKDEAAGIYSARCVIIDVHKGQDFRE